jgi:hypothetical protein
MGGRVLYSFECYGSERAEKCDAHLRVQPGCQCDHWLDHWRSEQCALEAVSARSLTNNGAGELQTPQNQNGHQLERTSW